LAGAHRLATVCFVSILLTHAWGVTYATGEGWPACACFGWEAASAHGLGWFGTIVHDWSR
tara:strand:- start:935 stop:1114 length:180 start_codon:yes stop_codon:yes gene_type:complete